GGALVDFLRIPANVVNEKATGPGLHGEGERVSQAERPGRTILAPCFGEERIVIGDGAIGVDAEQLSLERAQVLRGLAGGLIANGDVEFSVLAKVEGSALVAGRHGATEFRLIVPFEQDFLTARRGHVSRGGEPTDDM